MYQGAARAPLPKGGGSKGDTVAGREGPGPKVLERGEQEAARVSQESQSSGTFIAIR